MLENEVSTSFSAYPLDDSLMIAHRDLLKKAPLGSLVNTLLFSPSLPWIGSLFLLNKAIS